MQQQYEKFGEWLTLKKYSPATVQTTIRTVEYFREWAASENINDLEEVSYADAMGFMKWSSKHGASQKTIAAYLTHVRKFYQFLISEEAIKENPVAHIKVQGIKRKIYYDILTTEELQTLYQSYPTTIEVKGTMPPQQHNILARRRNKVVLSLLVHQGLRVEEVKALRLQDLQLREGKIIIHQQRRTAARTMQLASSQVYELMDYLHEVRKQMLVHYGETTDRLFINLRKGENFYSITQGLLKILRSINSRIKNLDQIRASVITEWLRLFDLRNVQYLAGHKYVSSTEKYKANVIDELQSDVMKFHPL